MALNHIDNGNISCGVRNGTPLGSWGSASLTVMLLKDDDHAQIDVRAHGHNARFSAHQLRHVAVDLLALAAIMPEIKGDDEKSAQLGSLVRTEEEYAALPVGAVVRSTDQYGTVVERVDIEDNDYRWVSNGGGFNEHRTVARNIGRALVIYLP